MAVLTTDYLFAGVSPTASGQIPVSTGAGGRGVVGWAGGSSQITTPLTVGGTGVGFTNSWVNTGGGDTPMQYWIDPFGYVHLSGVIQGGTIGNSAFTLPSNMWPSTKHFFSCVANSAFGFWVVTTAGLVVPTAGTPAFAVEGSFMFNT